LTLLLQRLIETSEKHVTPKYADFNCSFNLVILDIKCTYCIKQMLREPKYQVVHMNVDATSDTRIWSCYNRTYRIFSLELHRMCTSCPVLLSFMNNVVISFFFEYVVSM